MVRICLSPLICRLLLLQEVLKTFSDIRLAFGHSDEYSFVLHKSSNLYGEHTCHTWSPAALFHMRVDEQLVFAFAGRRASKLISLVTSCFSASYAYLWPQFFPATAMEAVPCFDGRAVAYPTDAILRDYLSWRQTDTHINNQVSPGCRCCCRLSRGRFGDEYLWCSTMRASGRLFCKGA